MDDEVIETEETEHTIDDVYDIVEEILEKITTNL